MEESILNWMTEEMQLNFLSYLPMLERSAKLGDQIKDAILGINDVNAEYFIPEDFSVLSDSQPNIKKFLKVFETLAQDKCLHVRLGLMNTGYRSLLLGGYDSTKIKMEMADTSFDVNKLKKTHELITKLRKIPKETEENKKNSAIFNLTTNFSKFFKEIPGYMIKLLACVFPNDFLPVFKVEDLKKFISIFEDPSEEYTNSLEDSLTLSQKLMKICKIQLKSIFTALGIENNPTNIANLLYLYSPFKKKPDLFKILKNIGYDSYPTDEQAVLGIFLLMLKSNNYDSSFNNWIPNFSSIRFTKIGKEFPDLIGTIIYLDKSIRTLYIELEFNLSKYKHAEEEKELFNGNIEDLYIICWEKDEKGNGIAKNKDHQHILSLKEVLLSIEHGS